MSEFCFEIPAVRGIQAGREFFTINAPFGVLQRLVAFDTGNVLSRSQRDVNPTRAKKVSQYIQENIDTYVLTSLTGVVGQCLLAQYGNVDKLADLSTLNIRRDSDEFVGRCIDEVTGNMLTNATAIKLTAIKMLCHVGCPVGPELQSLERQYFSDTEFPSVLERDVSSEEASLNEVFDEVEHRSVHLYAGMVRDKWPDLTEAQIDNVCDQVEVVVASFGETLESAKGNVQCMITKMRKSSTVLATIRANYKKVIAE